MAPWLAARLRRLLTGRSSLTGRSFLTGRSGDMVWNTLVIVSVLLPLSGLAIDVPRYFSLKSRLQSAVDAAAEAAAREVDIPHFQNTGDTRLKASYQDAAGWAFETAVADLRARGYTADFGGTTLDEAADAVGATGAGKIRLFYNLTPDLTITARAVSWYRLTRGDPAGG